MHSRKNWFVGLQILYNYPIFSADLNIVSGSFLEQFYIFGNYYFRAIANLSRDHTKHGKVFFVENLGFVFQTLLYSFQKAVWLNFQDPKDKKCE